MSFSSRDNIFNARLFEKLGDYARTSSSIGVLPLAQLLSRIYESFSFAVCS
jgi:hypothetical protein